MSVSGNNNPVENQRSEPQEQIVQTQEEEIKVWINCKNCGENYYIENQDEWQQNGLYYECAKCHENIETAFFGYCYNCKQYLGFRPFEAGSVLFEIAKGALKGWLDPQAGISGLTRFIDNIPSASAAGTCPFCNQVHLKCPQCQVSLQYPADAEDNAIVTCGNCGTKMRHP
jgi:RNase P subunit RPR2